MMPVALESHPVAVKAFGERARQARALDDFRRAQAGEPRSRASDFAIAVAELIDETVSDRDVGKWFRGEGYPGSPIRMWAFAKVLRVDPGWLYFDTESSAIKPSVMLAIPATPLSLVPRKRSPKKRH